MSYDRRGVLRPVADENDRHKGCGGRIHWSQSGDASYGFVYSEECDKCGALADWIT